MRFKCTMGLRNTLIVMALLLSGAASLKNHAFFNETGELPCHFPNTQNLSLDELVIFWQDQNKLVLYELFKGQEKPNNVNPKYIGRTSFDQDSWTLRLHNVQIKDTGSYQCFIHHRRSQGLVSIHQMSSDLIVLANFSQPEIRLIANQTEKSNIINLTCSSIQGYPEPQRMYVSLNTTNSSSTYDAVMKKSQSNITELYNVSISVSFPIPPETNVTIFCALQLEPTKIILSQPYNIDAKSPVPSPPVPDHILWIAALLVTVVVSGMVFLTLKKRKKKQPGPSNECEIIKVEEKESEQTAKRVELQEPERSDEVQCDVNISKTASDNKSATNL
ncbi:T-lymphocyte activation antigen CD86 isoform X2 [Bos indicus x Bos taurus]|uniref:T-lymphocyte activation antigen CD86 isoform X2 n=1 Tax=Bos indicus x Bos taurus TaxID=30522 RepID=UPI000F7D3281|nr:T-lymphocyte activation antigen CD86 isoform X2 [Bos indicus x Bos taurus]